MTLSNHYLPDVAEIERTHTVRDSVLALVRSIMAENRIEGKVLAVGSTAKDTFVKGDTDIDIFIVSPNYKEAYSLFKRKISGRRKGGPPLEMHKSVRAFKTIYPETFEKDGKVCTLIERERTDVVEWMKDLITDRMQNIGYKLKDVI
jgi:tRNA nucleotidyltransferase (CCA-adding enzyme)